MAIKANGTHAKEIAIHFLTQTTDGRFTSAIVKRSIGTVKSLLLKGYTKEEILAVIDYCLNVKKVNMYSIGYVSHCINDVLNEIKEKESLEQKREWQKQANNPIATPRKEEQYEQTSSERNRAKAERHRVQSSLGTKFNFDMFEKQ